MCSNAMMDINGKTKDNNKTSMDLAKICRQIYLELIRLDNGKFTKRKANYILNLDQRRIVCK